MDIKEIQNLIKFVAKSGANEVKLEMDDIKITIKTGSDFRDYNSTSSTSCCTSTSNDTNASCYSRA